MLFRSAGSTADSHEDGEVTGSAESDDHATLARTWSRNSNLQPQSASFQRSSNSSPQSTPLSSSNPPPPSKQSPQNSSFNPRSSVSSSRDSNAARPAQAPSAHRDPSLFVSGLPKEMKEIDVQAALHGIFRPFVDHPSAIEHVKLRGNAQIRFAFITLAPEAHSSIQSMINNLDRTFSFQNGSMITVKRWSDPRANQSQANSAPPPPSAYIPPPPLDPVPTPHRSFSSSSMNVLEGPDDDDAQLLISDLPSSASEAIVRGFVAQIVPPAAILAVSIRPGSGWDSKCAYVTIQNHLDPLQVAGSLHGGTYFDQKLAVIAVRFLLRSRSHYDFLTSWVCSSRQEFGVEETVTSCISPPRRRRSGKSPTTLARRGLLRRTEASAGRGRDRQIVPLRARASTTTTARVRRRGTVETSATTSPLAAPLLVG